MNERIKQLAAQAANYANTYDDAGADIWFEMYNEKFAELIVKECIDIAYEYDAPKMSGPGMIIGNRIKEHFGVEE